METAGTYGSPSLTLLTDLYQLTMAYGYWKTGRAAREAVFHLFFREPPFASGYVIAAGLGPALEFLSQFHFDDTDIDYLRQLTGNDRRPLFDEAFLDHLAQLELSVDIDAVREGTVVFAQEPLLRVRGPVLECQLLETALLNIVNFQSLVATKASRITSAAGGDSVIEFGLRRAQGIDGGLSASRAAYVGGCDATSNVLAGKRYGIPVKGTHAHSWVMTFDDELDAFQNYADVMPNNCVFLVDTYDTLQGVRHATEVGRRLRQQGHEMVGIRLDSGDLAYLSIEARKILDDAGFPDAVILASNDLDEHVINSVKGQGGKITVWGVGTKLATAYDQPALGGIYKLGAFADEAGNLQPRIKLSEQAAKITVPGVLQVRRFEDASGLVADMIFDENQGIDDSYQIVDITDPNRRKRLARETTSSDLLHPAVRQGRIVMASEPLEQLRQRTLFQCQRLHPSIRRFLNPHEYPVGLDIGLHQRRAGMIRTLRQLSE